MTTLHAGGKFEGQGYKVSGGLHGVGVSVVNALAEWLEVDVYRQGKHYHQHYDRGKPKKLVGELNDSERTETGTSVTFKPDHKIFDTLEFGVETIRHRLKELAYLNKGITINFTDERDPEAVETNSFFFEGGIAHMLKISTTIKNLFLIQLSTCTK